MAEVSTDLNSTCVEIVCKLNQARSPFLAAFLRSQFPEFEFTNSGIEVLESSFQNETISVIARLWGFPYLPDVSKQFQVLQGRIYFPVDDFIENYLQNVALGNQVLTQKPSNYPNFIRKPSDPLNLNLSELTRELALLLTHSIQCLKSLLPISSPHPLLIYRLENFLTVNQEMERLIRKNATADYFIVNLSLRTTSVDSTLRQKINPEDLFTTTRLSSVFSSKFEHVEPEKLYCSTRLRKWLEDLSLERPVILITSPLYDHFGELSVDSILGGAWATDIF